MIQLELVQEQPMVDYLLSVDFHRLEEAVQDLQGLEAYLVVRVDSMLIKRHWLEQMLILQS